MPSNLTKEQRCQQTRELREWRKSLGLCIQCGKNMAMPNRLSCPDCLYKATLRNIKYQKTEEQRVKYLSQMKDKYHFRKDQGLCVQCGKPLKDKSYVMCFTCRAKKSRNKRERMVEQIKGYKYMDSACLVCGKQAVPGKHYCEEHYREKLRLMEYANQCRLEKRNDPNGSEQQGRQTMHDMR